MICRLCLTNLKLERVVLLFQMPSNETNLIQIIAKFFYLKIAHDDPISTKICQQCRDHLENFYKFWTYVEAQQSTLQENYIALECDVAAEVEPSIDAANVGNNDDCKEDESQDEIPLDIRGIETALDMDHNERVIEDATALNTYTVNNYLTDGDGLPLLQLKTNVKKKTQKVVTDSNSQQTSERKAKLHRNIEIIDKAMDLNCNLCKASVEGYAQLRSHFSEKHDCPPYVMCCDRSFSQPAKLIQHINWHNSLFKCDICEKDLHSAKRLTAHKESFHSIKTDKAAQQTCAKCRKGFCSEKRLEKHITFCNQELVFACEFCHKEYSSEKRLRNHVTNQHETEKQKIFSCNSCEKTFPTAQRMQKHVETIHKKLYYHVCDVCGKQFRFKPSFEKHVLEHQGIFEPTAQCNLCGEWLKNAQALRLHKFKHDTVNVECHYCGRMCNSRRALICHINYTHKLDKNLQCKICDKTFKQPRNLEEHMAIHAGAQLYSCPHCTKECRSKSNMYVHIKRNHMKEWMESKAARSNDPNLNIQPQNQDNTS